MRQVPCRPRHSPSPSPSPSRRPKSKPRHSRRPRPRLRLSWPLPPRRLRHRISGRRREARQRYRHFLLVIRNHPRQAIRRDQGRASDRAPPVRPVPSKGGHPRPATATSIPGRRRRLPPPPWTTPTPRSWTSLRSVRGRIGSFTPPVSSSVGTATTDFCVRPRPPSGTSGSGPGRCRLQSTRRRRWTPPKRLSRAVPPRRGRREVIAPPRMRICR
mmetsp:Transcript_14129/g.40517  ORF Transcript_14129/g.40517 Transcript_14129/m.40517 type:complete len:215 (-) Transcript_14129:1726-2370(-)